MSAHFALDHERVTMLLELLADDAACGRAERDDALVERDRAIQERDGAQEDLKLALLRAANAEQDRNAYREMLSCALQKLYEESTRLTRALALLRHLQRRGKNK
jgi:hypothetical protein